MAWPIIAMAAMGAAQHYDQQKKADQQRKLQAETARYSPWTNMQANTNIADPSMAGTIGSGVVSGMQLQQGMDAQDAQQNYQNKMLEERTRYNNILENQNQPPPPQGGDMFSYNYPQQNPNAYSPRQSPWLMTQR